MGLTNYSPELKQRKGVEFESLSDAKTLHSRDRILQLRKVITAVIILCDVLRDKYSILNTK